ncbi:MAG: flippase-like domain-containing protein [Pirellulaceae bacterium]|nr:flippase-like domain-containing protein [Pirellulaceae bacterium]
MKLAVRCAVLSLVAWGVWKTLAQANTRLLEEQFRLSDLDPVWLSVAGALYLAGMVPSWLFWYRTLQVMGQRPGLLETLRAFYIGHLGKYVPGKALVVVLRTGLIRSERVDTAVAATSVFVETLTFMAVGSLLASGLLLLVTDQTWLILLAVGLLLVSAVPTAPPVFRQLVRWVGVRRVSPQIDQAIGGLGWRLLAGGWLLVAVGWGLLGLSLWATLRAVPAGLLESDLTSPWPHLPLLTACVGLAMVAGFLSLLPGGLGVRELVLIPLLTPVYGPSAAIVGSVLLRLVWLVAELLAAAILYVAIRSPRMPAAEIEHGPGVVASSSAPAMTRK